MRYPVRSPRRATIAVGTHHYDNKDSAYPTMNPKPETSRKIFETDRPVVLHGKVQYAGGVSLPSSLQVSSGDANQQQHYKTQTIRQRMQRHSEFSKLSNEMEQYEKMVTELSSLLEERTKEAKAGSEAWRAKILIGSAHKIDQELRERIPLYEKTLRNNTGDEELRAAQTACMKLHRDFQRLHKQLVVATSLHKRQQQVSRLGAVGWAKQENSENQRVDESKAETDRRVSNNVSSPENGRYPIDVMDEEMQNANRKGSVGLPAKEDSKSDTTKKSSTCYLDSLQLLCGTVSCGSEMYKPTDAAYFSADAPAPPFEAAVVEGEGRVVATEGSVIATDDGVIAVEDEPTMNNSPATQEIDAEEEEKSEQDCLKVYILGYLLD